MEVAAVIEFFQNNTSLIICSTFLVIYILYYFIFVVKVSCKINADADHQTLH